MPGIVALIVAAFFFALFWDKTTDQDNPAEAAA